MESVSDGACEVKGVSRADAAGTASLGGGTSSDGVEDSTAAASVLLGISFLGGNSTGPLEVCGGGRFRRLRGPLRGYESCGKSHGS